MQRWPSQIQALVAQLAGWLTGRSAKVDRQSAKLPATQHHAASLARFRRRLAPALAALAIVLCLLYRRYAKRRRCPVQGAAGGRSIATSASASRPAAPALPPPENHRLEGHVRAAAAWHRNGLRGEVLLGEDGGLVVFSAPQNPYLGAVMALLAPLGRSGEAAVAGVCAFVLVVMVATDVYGKWWPLAAFASAALTGLALAWIAACLDGKGRGKGVVAEALEAWASTAGGLRSAVMLHSVAEVPAEDVEELWQTVYRRAVAVPPPGTRRERGFAKRDGLGLLVDVDLQRVGTGDEGILEAFVLEAAPRWLPQGTSTGISVHHYAAARRRLCGPAAAAAATASLRALLAEARSEAVADRRDRNDEKSLDAKVAALELARQSLDRAVQVSDGVAGKWDDDSVQQTMKLSTQDAGTRFPMVRGVLEVSATEMLKSSGTDLPTTPLAKMAVHRAAEIFSFACSEIGRRLTDPTKDQETLLHCFGVGSGAWLIHTMWKGNPLQAAADGVFLCAVRRCPADGGRGERFTSVTVPASPEMFMPHWTKVEAARGGKAFKFQPHRVLLSVVDVLARADGSLRLCCVAHSDAEVSRMLPSAVVRSALLSVPLRGLAFADLACNLCVPSPLTLQTVAVGEETEEVHIAGRLVRVSRCLAHAVTDRPPPCASSAA